MQTIPLFHGSEWLLLNGGEAVPAAGGMRTFLKLRTFAFYESYDVVAFGGQGSGPPDPPTASTGGRRSRLRRMRYF